MTLGLELLPFLVVGVFVMGIIAVASRRDLDPAGARGYSLYLSGVSFIALFIVVFSLFGVISKVLQIPFDSSTSGSNVCSSTISGTRCESFGSESSSSFGLHSFSAPERDSDISSAVSNLIVGIFAGLAFVFHSRRLDTLTKEGDFSSSGAARTYLSVLYATCFVAVFTAVGGASAAVIGLYRAVAPGVAQVPGGGHADGFIQLVAGLALAAAGVIIYTRAFSQGAITRSQIAGA